MSILKTKVAHALRCRERQAKKLRAESSQDAISAHAKEDHSQDSANDQDFKENTPNRLPTSKPPSSNNIMKNYSRALTNFALSKIAQPDVALNIQSHGVVQAYFYRE